MKQALQRGLMPLVVMNKVDRETARISEVEDEIFDLFAALNASDEQMEYETVYASGKQGWVSGSAHVTVTVGISIFVTALHPAITRGRLHIPASSRDGGLLLFFWVLFGTNAR